MTDLREQAVRAFQRERLRYVHDQRRFAESKGWSWDVYQTNWHLNEVQKELENDSKLAERYLEVHEVGRDWGADARWVGERIRKLINRERAQKNYHTGKWTDPRTPKGINPFAAADDTPKDESGESDDEASASALDKIDADRSEVDQISDEELDRYEKVGLIQKDLDRGQHPYGRLRGRGGGTRDWQEFERIILGFIHDAGGANVKPGAQMPKEIVQVAHDKAVAHIDYLEPLVADLPYEAITYADLLICGYPIRLLADVHGVVHRDEYGNVIGSRLDRGTKRLVKSLQQCEGCGLPLIGVTTQGKPTTRRKTCDRACLNLKRRNLYAKRKAAEEKAEGAAT